MPHNDAHNDPSMVRVAAGAFGFLIFNHAFDGPDLYGSLKTWLKVKNPKAPAATRVIDGTF